MNVKKKARRVMSGLLTAVTVLSTVLSPAVAYASDDAGSVKKIPYYEEIKDQLDKDEVVTAKDYEIKVGDNFDVKNDYTGLTIQDDSKVKVTFQEAKDTDGNDFSTDYANSYKAVYYVEPQTTDHPTYQINRKIVVKEADQQKDSQSESSSDQDAGSSDKTETEDSEADSSTEETGAAETESKTELTEKEFDAEIEATENQETVDPETGITLSEVIQEAVDQEVALADLEAGESITFDMPMMLASGKTAKSILISCGARLAPFDIQELREIMSYDEMELDMIGDQRTAMFVIISDTDDTFNFVVAIMYTQLFNLLCDKADDEHGGRLPYHVRLLLDEFSNIGQIPKFDKLIATIRSREISASIILQSQSQLKTIYKDAAETITGNCDTVLFLGGKESSTLKEISETLGKETIDLYNTSDTRGSNRSYGLNYQKTGKELMSRDELAVMDGEKCILQLRGVRPFLSNKYDITKHKRYKELADFNKNNAFDVEKYLAHRLVMSEDTEFEMYEVTVTQEDVSAIEAEESED